MVRFTSNSAVEAALCDPDVELMLEVRAGNREAFDQLYRRYAARVHGVITHLMGHSRLSEDLTQEVFLRLYRARTSYVVGAKFSTWLFTIVNNVVLNARRSLARRREINLADPLVESPLENIARDKRHPAPDRVAQRAEMQRIVHQGVAQLGRRQRTAVSLCDLDGLSYAGVAEAMGTSPDAAKSLIHRGRVNLRKILEPRTHGDGLSCY